MYLLDTVVLSELRKPPRQRNRNRVRWIGEVPSQDLFVSVRAPLGAPVLSNRQ
jgi:predicted nucleic acid-binding protein